MSAIIPHASGATAGQRRAAAGAYRALNVEGKWKDNLVEKDGLLMWNGRDRAS